MFKEELNILKTYIESGIITFLVSNVPKKLRENCVTIKSNIDKSELNGHYENIKFCPPSWYKNLEEIIKNGYAILIIENMDEISNDEQLKFIELLKYRKISTFDLSKNIIILITYSNLKNISEEIYSLSVAI